LLSEELIDFLGVNCFSSLEPVDECLDLETLEFPLGPGGTLRRLGIPVKPVRLLLQLRDHLLFPGAGSR